MSKVVQPKTIEKRAAFNKRARKRIIFFIIFCAIIVVFALCTRGRFLSPDNLKVILAHMVFPTFIAWAIGFIFTSGIMELSIGSNVLLSANVGAIIAIDYNLGYIGLFIGTTVCAVILEFLSVGCCVKLKIPSWISALGMALIYEAILTEYSTQRAKLTGTTLINLGQRLRFFGLFPGNVLLLAAGFVAAYLLYSKTSIGINVQAIGSNPNVASAMGINKNKAIMLGALVGGVFIGLGSVGELSFAAYMPAYSGLTSIAYVFKALAAFLLADSLTDIAPYPVGVLFSTFLIMSVFNVLTHLGVPTGTGQDICLGMSVVACGIASKIGYKGVTK